jgi:MarR family 2-MHQ and catechol resistance regulon transcriptional repressor
MKKRTVDYIEAIYLDYKKKTSMILHPFKLTYHQYQVLHLLFQKTPQYPSMLSDTLKVDRPTMTVVLNQLEKSGYVTRKVDHLNRRFMIVSITQEGLDRYMSVAKEIQQLDNYCSNLSTEDEEQLVRLLKKCQIHQP